jgi:hypothetical protein
LLDKPKVNLARRFVRRSLGRITLGGDPREIIFAISITHHPTQYTAAPRYRKYNDDNGLMMGWIQ